MQTTTIDSPDATETHESLDFCTTAMSQFDPKPSFAGARTNVGLDVIRKIVIRLRRSFRRHAPAVPKMAAPELPYTSDLDARFR